MFYFIEQIKGTPKAVQGLHFGSYDLYDYYIVGCETNEEVTFIYHKEFSKDWKNSNRTNNPETFIKQYRRITKRERFMLTDKLMSFS